MKLIFAFVITTFLAVPAFAQDESDTPPTTPSVPTLGADRELDPEEFLWKNRLLVIFADSPGDPRFVEQMALINVRVEDLVDRDVIVLIDTDPAMQSDLREKYRPRGFMLVLIGKDGNVYLRKPRPWNVREISRSIDKMPIRREELRNQ